MGTTDEDPVTAQQTVYRASVRAHPDAPIPERDSE
jgi:hypothetical protein